MPEDLLICVWLKDSVGNISTPGTPAQEEGKSCFRFFPPTIDRVVATNSSTPDDPPLPEQLQTTPTKKDVFIVWRAKDQDKRTPLKMKADFSMNGTDFTLIQDNLINTENGTDCVIPAVPDKDDYGCFKWTTGVPIGETFEVRVTVTDTDGLSANAKGPKLNDPPAPPSPP